MPNKLIIFFLFACIYLILNNSIILGEDINLCCNDKDAKSYASIHGLNMEVVKIYCKCIAVKEFFFKI
jgi:hypothetical protein